MSRVLLPLAIQDFRFTPEGSANVPDRDANGRLWRSFGVLDCTNRRRVDRDEPAGCLNPVWRRRSRHFSRTDVALHRWLLAKARGLGQGIFHAGARIGAAASLVLMPLLIDWIDWRTTFVVNALIGLTRGAFWWFWCRDQASEHADVNDAEVELIRRGIEEEAASEPEVPSIQVVISANTRLAVFYHASSNISQFDVCVAPDRSGSCFFYESTTIKTLPTFTLPRNIFRTSTPLPVRGS